MRVDKEEEELRFCRVSGQGWRLSLGFCEWMLEVISLGNQKRALSSSSSLTVFDIEVISGSC